MPITIDVASDPTIGPGSHFLVTTDIAGPIELDWRWIIIINGDDAFEMLWRQEKTADGSFSLSGTLGIETNGWEVKTLNQHFDVTGTETNVVVTLQNALGVLQDSGSRTDLLWTTQGDATLLVLKDREHTDGLTVPQAAQLAAASTAVQMGFTGSAGDLLSSAVGALVVHPPIGLLHLSPDPLVLTGRGSLTPPHFGPIVTAFGANVAFFTVPTGFGYRDGAAPEFSERVLQLATVHVLIDEVDAVMTEVADFNVDGSTWLWNTAFPSQVLYDVTPGCVVVLRWLEL